MPNRLHALVALCTLLGAGCPFGGAEPELGDDSLAAVSLLLAGLGYDSARDVAVDAEGNVYLTGGTSSPDFPTTPGAYDTEFDSAGARAHDVFVAKLDPDGALLWSTLLGGPEYDRAYALELDPEGHVVVAGRAGAGFPVTSGAFQTDFGGGPDRDPYGPQDGFVCKLRPDGGGLVFCSYLGTGDDEIVRDVAVDAAGDIYLAGSHRTGVLPEAWFEGSFQEHVAGKRDGLIAKVKADGSAVVWATHLGGSGDDAGVPSIRVGADGSVYFMAGYTDSPDLPTSEGAFDRSYNGRADLHLARIAPDGSRLLFATYLGGSEVEFSETHALALTPDGRAYVAATTTSPDFPTTAGSVQPRYGGTRPVELRGGNYPGDAFVALFSPEGRLLASTFLGGSGGEGLEGVDLDLQGRVAVSGATFSEDFPVSADAPLARRAGGADFFVVRLSPGLDRLVQSTYWGGSGFDFGRCIATAPGGDLWAGGQTESRDFPRRGALETRRQGAMAAALLRLRAPVSDAPSSLSGERGGADP